ncbi:hypothetical protein WDU94_015627 [Cyamophila willieti]
MDDRFSHLHVDIVGPLPPSRGSVYMLTCIDRYTRWLEVFPIPDQTAETIARTLFEGWICRFGTPVYIVTDQGRNFLSFLFREVATLLGITLKNTTAYHPQGNGLVERSHRTLKAALMCRLNFSSDSWTLELPAVLLGLRASYKEDLQASPANLVYGTTLRLPGEYFEDPNSNIAVSDYAKKLHNIFENLRPKQTAWHTNIKPFVHPHLDTCTHVYVRVDATKSSLQRPYTGPHRVVSRSDKTFKIIIGTRQTVVSRDRVKPAFLSDVTHVSPTSHPLQDVVCQSPELLNNQILVPLPVSGSSPDAPPTNNPPPPQEEIPTHQLQLPLAERSIVHGQPAQTSSPSVLNPLSRKKIVTFAPPKYKRHALSDAPYVIPSSLNQSQSLTNLKTSSTSSTSDHPSTNQVPIQHSPIDSGKSYLPTSAMGSNSKAILPSSATGSNPKAILPSSATGSNPKAILPSSATGSNPKATLPSSTTSPNPIVTLPISQSDTSDYCSSQSIVPSSSPCTNITIQNQVPSFDLFDNLPYHSETSTGFDLANQKSLVKPKPTKGLVSQPTSKEPIVTRSGRSVTYNSKYKDYVCK